MTYKYNKKYDTFCFQNCINYILQQHGVENSELYINKSLSLVMEKESGYALKYHFHNHCGSVVPSYADKITTFRSKDDAKTVLEKVIENKIEERKIIMGVDSYEISYLPFYKKSHGLHSVVVNFVDYKKRLINVTDCMEPWYFEGDVNLEEFLRARNSNNNYDGGMFSNIAIDNVWKEVDYTGYNATQEQLVMEQVLLSLDQYYHGGEDKKSIFGLNAFDYMVQKLKGYAEIAAESQNALLEGIHRLLFRFNHRRVFWTSFLDCVPESMKTELFLEYQNQFEKMQEEWEKMLYKILILKMRKKDKLWKDVIDSFELLLNKDRECGELLEEYAKTGE